MPRIAKTNLQTSKTSKKRGLPKGKTNNPKGRIPGSKNKRSLEWEAFGKQVIEGGLPQVLSYMEELATEDPDHHFENFTKLLEYFKPKLARTELTGKNGQSLLTLDEVLKKQENELKEKPNQ